MTWCSFGLPARAWTVLAPDGRMIVQPVQQREHAEHLLSELFAGVLRSALRRGYRVVEVELRLFDGNEGT
jgi:hypothetical protein